MLDKKLKDLKIKADDHPDVLFKSFWSSMHKWRKVGEGLTERILIDIVTDKLIPDKCIITFMFSRDPISLPTAVQN